MVLFDDDLDALPDFLHDGMHIAGEFGFGNADGSHVLDHSLFSPSLSSLPSAASENISARSTAEPWLFDCPKHVRVGIHTPIPGLRVGWSATIEERIGAREPSLCGRHIPYPEEVQPGLGI